ncbi:MAG TPA: acetate/propionate family kinase [Chitinophagaceae bacterium]|nr:acetate/propionate family kinase [Chitinophagaceae bacterium]
MPDKQVQTIAAINSGSSTLKFGLFSFMDPLRIILKGKIAGIGTQDCSFAIENEEEHNDVSNPVNIDSVEKAAELLIKWLQHLGGQYQLCGIGHRVVHGGLHYDEPVLIEDKLICELEKIKSLAPLHLPDAIAIINSFKQAFPGISQVACFDTAFHKSLPFEARYYAIPRSLWSDGVVRYGFHGISCEYIYQKLKEGDDPPGSKKIIIAHLGSGSSITAIKNGHSIETTMGFSPAGGLMMNTRAGDIDPGVLIYLLKEKKMDPEQLDHILNRESGIKAVAENELPVEKLLEKKRNDSKSRQAIIMYCYHARKQIGALAATMGGLDTIVFTGGIGEHSPEIRKLICSGLEFIGVALNNELNDHSAATISELSAPVKVHVIATNEEVMIASHVKEYIKT